MKKIIALLVIIAFAFGCSSESTSSEPKSGQSDSSGDTGKGGSLARFTILNNYLYTVDYGKLNVFSLLNPEEPVFVNAVPVGFDIETLFSYKNYLYIGSKNGMFIYDASSPETPVKLSQVNHFTACDPVIANDSYAFVTLHSNTDCGGNNKNVLQIYDITDVKNPVFISSRNLVNPIGIGLYKDYLFVCDDEVKVFDVSNPKEAKLVYNINKESFDVIVYGDLLVLIGKTGLHQYRLNNDDIKNTEFLSTLSI